MQNELDHLAELPPEEFVARPIHRDEVLSGIESSVTAEIVAGTFGLPDDLELPERPTTEPVGESPEDEHPEKEHPENNLLEDHRLAAQRAAEARVKRARAELERAESELAAVVQSHSRAESDT